ncbi:hypothetical protein ACI2IY_08025 [Lysobacter enzymogenes]|uniref:hypothetical protein n=1 Tax=Lysobacter enzymogenes TaxID=69 RepID=UPI001A96128E|nr:hypothetical protein [Lysobacter enzymogenes]QQP94906.1 hypothetical protein JHW38_16840 [Lysobacter enzymogenes]
MGSIRHTLSFLAAFAFAAGFAGSALAAGNCSICMGIYDRCMAQPDADQGVCARLHNQCAQPKQCPLMPEF